MLVLHSFQAMQSARRRPLSKKVLLRSSVLRHKTDRSIKEYQVKEKSRHNLKSDRSQMSDIDSKPAGPRAEEAAPASRSRRAFIGGVAAGVVALPPLLSSTGS